jgi:hypothetical protein
LKEDAMSAKKPARTTSVIGSLLVGLMAVCVVGAAMIASRSASEPTPDVTMVDAPAVEPALEQVAQTTPPEAARVRPRAKATPNPKGKTTANTSVTAASTVVTEPVTSDTLPSEIVDVKGPAMVTTEVPAAQERVYETVTGCLEQDSETFRLTDTEGADAPKARSWRTGFLKKRSASVVIVDSADVLKLASHVGQRVSVTGLLDDREMVVRTLHRVGELCD